MPWDQTDPPKGCEYYPASAPMFKQVFNPFQNGMAPYTLHTRIQEVNTHRAITGTEQSMIAQGNRPVAQAASDCLYCLATGGNPESALTHTTASAKINDTGLEKSQAKQGLSHAKSFFCGCPRMEFDISGLWFHHQNELPRRKADMLLCSSSLSLIISNALQVLMTQTSDDGWRQENNDDHFILGKRRLSSQVKSTVMLRKATAYLDSVL